MMIAKKATDQRSYQMMFARSAVGDQKYAVIPNQVDINYLINTSDKLSAVIRNSFGPNGKFCLILQSTGHTLLTSDGKIILENIHFNDPISSYIIHCSVSFKDKYGDGSKTFVLFLNELLKCINKYVTKETSSQGEKTMKLQQISRDLISFNLQFSQEAISYPKIQLDDKQQIKLLLEGLFRGKFSDYICTKLVDLTIDLILKSYEQKIACETLEFLIRNYSIICVINDSSSFNYSYACGGCLVNKELSMALSQPRDVKFAIITCSLNKYGKEIVFKTNSEIELAKVLRFTHIYFEKLFTNLREIGVQLLLSLERFPENLQFLTKKLELSVLHGLGEETASYIIETSGIQPITTLNTCVDVSNICVLGEVKPIKIGANNYTQLNFSSQIKNINPCYLVLAGSALNTCKQYSDSVLNALKYLKVLLSNSFCSGATCAVGGKWEFLVSQFVIDESNKIAGDLKYICRILSDALLIVPKTIFKNSNNCSNQTFLQLNHTVQKSVELPSIDWLTGSLEICSELELVECKSCLVCEVIAAVSQLLKIETTYLPPVKEKMLNVY